MRKYGKFAALMAIIISSLLWLATASVSSSKTYYVTIQELHKMGNNATKARPGRRRRAEGFHRARLR